MRIAYKNFNGGEVSPTLVARYDLPKLGTCVLKMQNCIPGLHGDAHNRTGFRFIAELDDYAVLIPFSFTLTQSKISVLSCLLASCACLMETVL